jgi:hypothetical protein
MPAACTVVIGAQHHLDALRGRADAGSDVLTFLDTDPLGALTAIAAKRAEVVIFERLFAVTSRGAALLNRIKADPALVSTEIRVLSHDGEYSRVSPRRAPPRGAEPVRADPADAEPVQVELPRAAAAHAEPLHAPALVSEDLPPPLPPAPVAVTTPPPPPELDWRGTRRAERIRMRPGTDAQVNGAPATIVDLSELGAQVLAQAALRPQQRVWVAMGDDAAALRFDATVAWASFEIAAGVTRYRAGLEFRDASADAVLAFAARHKAAE